MINIDKLIKDKGLDPYEVAQAMFPNQSRSAAYTSLWRVKQGREMKASQLKALADAVGEDVTSLLSKASEWKGKRIGGVYAFERSEYIVSLPTDTWTASIRREGNFSALASIPCDRNMPLSAFLSLLDDAIISLNSNIN